MTDITVEELKTRLDNGEKPILIDVREPFEYTEFNIGGELHPLGSIAYLIEELANHKNDEIIVHCRSGMRSFNAQQYLMQQGFTNVRN